MNRRAAWKVMTAVAVMVALAACGSSGGGSASLPIYQPSTVVSQSDGHTQLTSPDSAQKVSAFYRNALNGWTIISSTSTASTTNTTARRGHQGVMLAISSTGRTNTLISISTYPA